MKGKNHSQGAFVLFCSITLFLLASVFVGNASAKSVYLSANHHTSEFDAWNINPDGTVTKQATYMLQHSTDPAGIGIDAITPTGNPVMFISSEGSGGLEIVDPVTLTYMGVSSGPTNLSGVDVNDADDIVYALKRQSNSLYIFIWDPIAKTLTQDALIYLPNISYGYGIALDDSRDILWVSDTGNSMVRAYNVAVSNWSNIAEIPALSRSLSHSAIDVAVDASRNLVYTVAGWAGSNLISKYDVAAGTETTVDVGHGAMGVAVDETTGYVYITGGGSYGNDSGDNLEVWNCSASPFSLVQATTDLGNPAGIAIANVSYNPLNLTKNDIIVGKGVYVGSSFAYRIACDNANNNYDAENVTLLDDLPIEVDFVSATQGGVYDPAAHTVFWDIGTIAAGEVGPTIELKVKVNENATSGSTVYNYCTINADGIPPTTVIDQDPDDPDDEPGSPVVGDEFIWQQIDLDGDVYTVKVKANEKPDDPSIFVYPNYSGLCNPELEPDEINVYKPNGQIETDENTQRKIFGYARNAALYRSWAGENEDPIPILDKLGGFHRHPKTPEARHCCTKEFWVIPELCLFKIGGGTDTSFYKDYPGYLAFPDEYTVGNGIPNIIDWDYNWESLIKDGIAGLCGGILDVIHPVGIANYNKRQAAYEELLRKIVIQESRGIHYMLLDGWAKGLVNILETAKPYITAASTLSKVDKILMQLKHVSVTAKILKEVMATRIFDYDDILNLADGINAAHNFTAVGEKLAPVFLNSVSVITEAFGIGFRLAGDVMASIFYTGAMIDYGREILDAMDATIFASSSGLDHALWSAYFSVREKISTDLEREWWKNLGKEFLRLSQEHGLNYLIDATQMCIGVATLASLLAPEPILTKAAAGVLFVVNVGLEALQQLAEYHENQENQQKIVLCSTLEYSWWNNPIYTYGLPPFQFTGPVQSGDVDRFNWLVSSKLYQGVFVTETMFDLKSGFLKDIEGWLDNIFGSGEFNQRRKDVESYKNRLIKIFFGEGDTDPVLCRLTGRRAVEGEYIGFVPKKELDYLLSPTKRCLHGVDELNLNLCSPGEIGIIDPAGRHLGTFVYDAGGGNFISEDLSQIPGGTDSGPGTEPRNINIPQPPLPGEYEIILFGKESGPYTVKIQALSEGSVLSESITHGVFKPNRAEDGVFELEDSTNVDAIELTLAPIPRGDVAGIVTDAATGTPIAGARVQVGDTSDISSTDGSFQITNVVPGTLIITGSARGYHSYVSDEVALAPGEQLVHYIQLNPVGITLNTGWNLISLYTQPDNTGIDTVLGPISGKYSCVWAFQNNSWKVYDPDHPGFSDLSTMEPGWGYYIYMTEAATLPMTGTEPSKSIDLIRGWNLVGYNSCTHQPIADALKSIEGKYVSVWAYINGQWRVYDPANPGFSDLTTMEPGYGYWIKTKQNCTWTLP
jgi:hypothetical protein